MGLREKGRRGIRESRQPIEEVCGRGKQRQGLMAREVGSRDFHFNGRNKACLRAAGNNAVESEKLLVQGRTGERRVIRKPPKELPRLFRPFTPGIPYPRRDIYYIVMILSCQMTASGPIGRVHPVISISVSSAVVYYPPTQGTAVAGHFCLLNMEPCAAFAVQTGP